MPVIYIYPDPQQEANPEDYLCPVYKTSTRAG